MEKSNAEIEFTSFSWKRCIAGIILFLLGLHDMVIFSPLSGRHVPTGSIMTFEGPSYFLAAGLVPFLTGIGLLLYTLLSYFKGKIERTEQHIIIEENRPKRFTKTKLNTTKILAMDLSNNKIGIKYLWLFLFIPYLIINYYYMALNFNQPFVSGLVNTTAMVILISVILSSICMIILFQYPQWLLQIYTKDGYYEMWFEPFKITGSRMVVDQIAEALDIIETQKKKIITSNPFANLSLRKVIIGGFFLGYGIFNVLGFMTTLVSYQTIIVYILIIAGVYILSKELRKIPFPNIVEPSSALQLNLSSHYYQEYLTFPSYDTITTEYKHETFDVFWVICAGLIFIMVPFKMIQIWLVLSDFNFEIIIGKAMMLTIFGILIMFMQAYYLLTPRLTMNIRKGEISHHMPVKRMKEREDKSMGDFISDGINAFKKNFEEGKLRRNFLKRVVFIILCLVIAILALLWQYWYYFNLFNIFN